MLKKASSFVWVPIAPTMQWVKREKAQRTGDVRTAALGNGWNDLPMLEEVDHPFLTQPPDGSHQNGVQVENLTHLKGTGPEAWKDGVFGLLNANDPAAANPSIRSR
jgi:predicted mannosyl-3-phosphoglycerate phosphatase (HAD superfamily)